MMLIWKPNWYLTYHYWPTSYNTHIFEGTLYFVPPTNAYERLQQELAVVTFKEYSLQDGNTLEATQSMLETPRGRASSRCATRRSCCGTSTRWRSGYVDDHQRRAGPTTPVRISAAS